jgi:hypothetical protein
VNPQDEAATPFGFRHESGARLLTPAKGAEQSPAAEVLSGPRSRPEVKVSIGSIQLSTEAPQEAPRPQARQQQAKRPGPAASGIWSGGRSFARSYLRRG